MAYDDARDFYFMIHEFTKDFSKFRGPGPNES